MVTCVCAKQPLQMDAQISLGCFLDRLIASASRNGQPFEEASVQQGMWQKPEGTACKIRSSRAKRP